MGDDLTLSLGLGDDLHLALVRTGPTHLRPERGGRAWRLEVQIGDDTAANVELDAAKLSALREFVNLTGET